MHSLYVRESWALEDHMRLILWCHSKDSPVGQARAANGRWHNTRTSRQHKIAALHAKQSPVHCDAQAAPTSD